MYGMPDVPPGGLHYGELLTGGGATYEFDLCSDTVEARMLEQADPSWQAEQESQLIELELDACQCGHDAADHHRPKLGHACIGSCPCAAYRPLIAEKEAA